MTLTSVDHKALVEAHNSGDDDAFPAIVRVYYEGLFRHALRRLHDVHAAEDAVQETLSRAYRALPRFSGDYELRAWLHRILTNVCYDEGRRRHRENQLVERVAGVPPESVAFEDDFEALDLPRHDVLDALRALPSSHREALVLRYVEEKSFQEVAQATGITEGNARLRVHRGRIALRRALRGTVAVIVWVVPLLRRGERSVVAELARSQAGALASGMPVATRVGETAMPLVDRTPAFTNLIGVAATLVVPAAVPMASSTLQQSVAPPPAVVAPPATDARPAAPVVPEPDAMPRPLPAPSTTTTTVATTATTVATNPVSTTSTTVAPAGDNRPNATGAATAPAATARRAGRLVSDDLVVAGADRATAQGTMRVTVGSESSVARLTAWFELPADDEPAPEDGSASSAGEPQAAGDGEAEPEAQAAAVDPEPTQGEGRPFTGELNVRLPDGTPLRLALTGTAVSTGEGTWDVEGTYRLTDACPGERGTGATAGKLTIAAAPAPSSLALDLASFATDLASLRTGATCAEGRTSGSSGSSGSRP